MFEFLRLLEANMSMDEAKATFKRFGATDDDLKTPETIKAARNKLVKKAHTDVGGSQEAISLINSAYDTIRHGIKKEDPEPNTYNPPPPNREPTPVWAMAGYSGGVPSNANISRQNYTDINYIKKSMYFMSKDDEDQQVYTVHAFDGHFFRGQFTTYASPEIFQELVQAMVMWNNHGGNSYATRAVFIQRNKTPELFLLYSDGKYYTSNPIEFKHDSFNLNPDNDQQFLRRLPDMLDKLKG